MSSGRAHDNKELYLDSFVKFGLIVKATKLLFEFINSWVPDWLRPFHGPSSFRWHHQATALPLRVASRRFWVDLCCCVCDSPCSVVALRSCTCWLLILDYLPTCVVLAIWLDYWTNWHLNCVCATAMAAFTSQEQADIVFMYGKADGNGALARRLYQERYPNRR